MVATAGASVSGIARLRRLGRVALKAAVLPGIVPWIVAAALVERGASAARRRASEKPRLAYGPVTIVHAPNHRAINRSAAVIEACETLRTEGLQVELRLLERVPNARIREEVERADILCEQLILGYGLAAIEGMSLARPVVGNLSDERYFGPMMRRATRIADCPIVSATPETLREVLHGLVTDPALRRRIGEAGRAHVLREHSYPAMARLWSAIYRRVWHGEAVDPSLLVRPIDGGTTGSLVDDTAAPRSIEAGA